MESQAVFQAKTQAKLFSFEFPPRAVAGSEQSRQSRCVLRPSSISVAFGLWRATVRAASAVTTLLPLATLSAVGRDARRCLVDLVVERDIGRPTNEEGKVEILENAAQLLLKISSWILTDSQ